MATVRVRVPSAALARPAARRKALIVSPIGEVLPLPFAPVQATLDGFAQPWTQLGRTGTSPLLLSSGRSLPTWAGSILLAYSDWTMSVQHLVDLLAHWAADGTAVTFRHGGPERGRWRITGLQFAVQMRTASNDVGRALASLTLTRASDLPARVGPVSGGHAPPPAPASGRAPGGSSSNPRPTRAAPRTYTVRSGDTLFGIAIKVYRDASRWPQIASANGIRNPAALRVGQVLKIP